jgi:RNA polymerase sigma factor (sigma-70 family)
VELAKDKIDLIEKIIKNDRKFANNEDLYDDFFNETCKRSLLIVQTVTSDVTLEAYLRKIATTSILNVLKNEGRLRRTKSGFMSTQNVPIETTSSLTDYSKVTITYEPVDIQDTPEDLAVKKDILQKIVDIVYEIDQDAPDKNYLRLYNLRYADGLTQKEIAQELNLSQSEVSKRLFKLMDKVKQAFNG